MAASPLNDALAVAASVEIQAWKVSSAVGNVKNNRYIQTK